MTTPICFFTSCRQRAYYRVTKNGQTITVCADCRDGLTQEGWTFAGFDALAAVRSAQEAKSASS